MVNNSQVAPPFSNAGMVSRKGQNRGRVYRDNDVSHRIGA
jgi:hypothetical protein